MKLTKDLTLSSGRVVKKGTEITTDLNSKGLMTVTKSFYKTLIEQGYFSKLKKNSNNSN